MDLESATRLQEMEDLQQQLVYADGEGGGLGRGSMSSRAAQILQSLDACTRSASDLDYVTVSRGIANLLLLLDRDDSMLRTLALPSSLAALVRCADGGLVQDEAAVSAYVRLLLALCSGHAGGAAQPDARASQAGHAQSVLRSGALTPALSWLFDVRVLTETEDKRALLEAVFLCVEETLTREDAALLLDISRRLIDAVLGEYEGYRCEVRGGEGATDGAPGPGRAFSSVSVEVRRMRGSSASDAVVVEYACRCTARLVTILSRRAEGHWQLWRTAYEAGEDEARAAVKAFARQRNEGHCAYAASGSQGSTPQGDCGSTAESWTFAIEGVGVGLTHYAVRALVRALARLLVVFAEHSRLASLRPSRALRCVPMPAYGDAVHCLVQRHGLAGIALRLLSLSAGQDLAAPDGSSAVPALMARTLARDAEGLEDCLLLLAALMKTSR